MNATLDTLRTAHGAFVITMLSRADRINPVAVVGSLVAQNRWAAAQLQALPKQPSQQPINARDLGSLLAELAASCAEIGKAIASCSSVNATQHVLAHVIGHYQHQTALLQRTVR